MFQRFLAAQLYRRDAKTSHKTIIGTSENFFEKLTPEIQDSTSFGLVSSDDYSVGAILCRAVVEQDVAIFNYFDLTKLSVEDLDDVASLLFSRRDQWDENSFNFAVKLLPYLDVNNKIHLLSYTSRKGDWQHFDQVDATFTENDDLSELEMDKLKYFVRDNHLERAMELTKKIIADVRQEASSETCMCPFTDNTPLFTTEELEYLKTIGIAHDTCVDEEFLENIEHGTIKDDALTKLEHILHQGQREHLFEVVRHMGLYGVNYNNISYLEFLMDEFDENYVDEIIEFSDSLIVIAALDERTAVVNFLSEYSSDFDKNVAMAIMSIHSGDFNTFKEIFDKLTIKEIPLYLKGVFMHCSLQSSDCQFINHVNKYYNFITAMIDDENHKNNVRMSLPVIKWINQKFPEYKLPLVDIFNNIEDDAVWLEYLEYFSTTNQLNNNYDILDILSGYLLQRHSVKQQLATVQKLLTLLSQFDATRFESTLHQLGSIYSTKNRNAVIIDYLVTHLIDIKIPEELLMAVACYDNNRQLFLKMLNKVNDALTLEKLANNLSQHGYRNLNKITLMYRRKM